MSLLNHQELAIVHGLAPLPGDTASNESVKEYINLLTPGQNGGIVLDSLNGWSPNIPGLKNDGIWSESAISPGRRLVAGERSNATEIMNIEISGATYTDYYAERSRLERIIERCREFWTSEFQIDPVYLVWWAANAPGAQYALLYNINIALNDADDNQVPPFTVTGTLEMEREVAWRWEVPPGSNPKRWAYYQRGELELWNYNTASLIADDTEHFKYDTVQNKREWNTTQTDILSRNYVDIAAADIPGDAPALLCLSITPTTEGTINARPNTMLVGRITKPRTIKERDGDNFQSHYVLNVGDSGLQLNSTTLAADTGAPRSNSTTTGTRSETTFAVAGDVERLRWDSALGEDMLFLSNMRGRWAFYARARLSAANTTVAIRLRFGHYTFNQLIDLPKATTSNQGAGGTGNTSHWGLIYLGEVKLPLDARLVAVSPDGRGIVGGNSVRDMSLKLFAERTAGAGSLYMSDLIMFPVDEPAVLCLSNNLASVTMVDKYLLLDNTGYMMHGQNEQHLALVNAGSPLSDAEVTEWQGQPLTLIPGVDNRLTFLGFDNQSGGDTKRSSIADVYNIRLNIVPRSYGVRTA